MNDNNNNTELEPENNQNQHYSGPSLQNPTMNPIKAAIFGLFAVFFLYQFGGAILTLLIFGFDFESADVNALRLLTTGSQVLLILLPGLIFAKLVFEDVSSVIRLKMPDWKGIGLFILGLIILTPLLQSFIYIQNYLLESLSNAFPILESIKALLDQLDKFVEQAYDKLLVSHSFFESSFIVFVVAVTPAICEEVFFRGFVQKSFELKMKPFGAMFITALFFGFYHFSPYGLIGLTALGLYFGYAVYKTDSIITSMLLHFLNNFFAILLYFMFESEDYMSASAVPSDGIGQYIISFIFLSALFLLLLFGIKKYYHSLSPTSNGEEDDLS